MDWGMDPFPSWAYELLILKYGNMVLVPTIVFLKLAFLLPQCVKFIFNTYRFRGDVVDFFLSELENLWLLS